VERSKDVIRRSPGSGVQARVAGFPLGGADEVILLPDGRTVADTNASGHGRLMTVEEGKDPVPLVNTQEPTGPPMTLAGPHEVAFIIGPRPRETIALADTATGRITRRIAPGKVVIECLTASATGEMLWFCAGGSVWTVPSGGGEARKFSDGEYAVIDPSGRDMIVVRGESSHIRFFRISLDGREEREIPLDRSIPVYPIHAGQFSSGSMDAKGRLLVSLSPLDSWFNGLGVLDTGTGRIDRLPVDRSSDHHSGAWTPDGGIVYSEVRMRAAMWKFLPAD